MSFWNKYSDSIAQATAGGSRYVGKVRIEFGYKVYTGDVGQNETWFPVKDGTDKEQRKQALTLANVLRERLGYTGNQNRAQYGIQITRFRDATVRMGESGIEPVGWKDDLRENVDAFRSVQQARNGVVTLFNRATKEKARVSVDDVPGGRLSFDIVGDSLDGSKVDVLPWEGYATLAWTDDPEAVYFGDGGKWEKDQDGNPKFPQVAYLTETFTDEAAARAALGTPAAEATSVSGTQVIAPEGWNAEAWYGAWSELFERRKKGETQEEIAKAYQVTEEDVKRALLAYTPY